MDFLYHVCIPLLSLTTSYAVPLSKILQLAIMSEKCLVFLWQLVWTSFVPNSALGTWGGKRKGNGLQWKVVLAILGYTCPTGITHLVTRVESCVRKPPLPSALEVITQTLRSITAIIDSKRLGPFNASETKVSPGSAWLCSYTKQNISSSHFWLLSYILPKEHLYPGRISQQCTCSSGELLGDWHKSFSTELYTLVNQSEIFNNIKSIHHCMYWAQTFCEHRIVFLPELKQFTEKEHSF